PERFTPDAEGDAPLALVDLRLGTRDHAADERPAAVGGHGTELVARVGSAVAVAVVAGQHDDGVERVLLGRGGATEERTPVDLVGDRRGGGLARRGRGGRGTGGCRGGGRTRGGGGGDLGRERCDRALVLVLVL